MDTGVQTFHYSYLVSIYILLVAVLIILPLSDIQTSIIWFLYEWSLFSTRQSFGHSSRYYYVDGTLHWYSSSVIIVSYWFVYNRNVRFAFEPDFVRFKALKFLNLLHTETFWCIHFKIIEVQYSRKHWQEKTLANNLPMILNIEYSLNLREKTLAIG